MFMVASDTTYNYQVRARDAAGNLSALSDIATVTTDALLFSDGFESGNLSSWIGGSGLVIQQTRALCRHLRSPWVSTGNAAYAYKDLSVPQDDLYYRIPI